MSIIQCNINAELRKLSRTPTNIIPSSLLHAISLFPANVFSYYWDGVVFLLHEGRRSKTNHQSYCFRHVTVRLKHGTIWNNYCDYEELFQVMQCRGSLLNLNCFTVELMSGSGEKIEMICYEKQSNNTKKKRLKIIDKPGNSRPKSANI